MKKHVIVIVGPTASGKSALAVELARRINGEIISADSRQVYRGLNIGTGKITKREMKDVPHHLLDNASPRTTFTAHDFLKHGRATIDDILARGKVPIICGGTGFYIDALLNRITLPNVPPDETLRKELRTKTPAELFIILTKLDPKRATSIDQHNPVRLIRAIEIAKKIGTVPEIEASDSAFSTLWIGIEIEKESLEEKIHIRLLQRMKQGMLAEARALHQKGLSYKRMEALGLEYRFLARLLQKKTTRAQMLLDLETEIRRYAKRQRTYFRRNTKITWLKNPALQRALELANSFLSEK